VGTSIPGIVKNQYRGVSWVSSLEQDHAIYASLKVQKIIHNLLPINFEVMHIAHSLLDTFSHDADLLQDITP